MEKIKLIFFNYFLLIFHNFLISNNENLDGEFTNIKILDKISSKNTLLKLKNGEDLNYKDF